MTPTRPLRVHLVLLSLTAGMLLLIPALRATETSSDADARWQHVKDLQQQLSQPAPKGTNEVEFFTPLKAQLHGEAEEFAAAFPHDPRRWEATLLEVKTTNFPGPEIKRKVLFDENEAIVAAIEAADDAPPEIKENARRTILFQHLDHLDLLKTPQELGALDKRMLAFVHDYPDDPKVASMQVRRADVLARSEPAQVRPLLGELAQNANPKIAATARGRLKQFTLAQEPLDWKFTSIDGRNVDFSQLRGRVILIDYWATWCPDCLRALPQVQASYGKYRAQGFEVVGISLDNDQEALQSFLKKHGLPWPEYFDGKGWQSDLVTKYGVGGIPEMWLVNKEGHVIATGVQADELDGKIGALIGG